MSFHEAVKGHIIPCFYGVSPLCRCGNNLSTLTHTYQVSRIMRESHAFALILTVSRMEAISLTHGTRKQ